ncbi:hypothetical protein HD806DRAFT_551716 [Xylariaceae sp. AK1471]|nr:hypothetical protein HD806DRAFT_551716 [Xylariaceae sp. AK1471]
MAIMDTDIKAHLEATCSYHAEVFTAFLKAFPAGSPRDTHSSIVHRKERSVNIDFDMAEALLGCKAPRPAQYDALSNLHISIMEEQFFIICAGGDYLPLESVLHDLIIRQRIWERGIRSLLEVLRPGLPDSYGQMRRVTIRASALFTDLLIKVPSYKGMWNEFLGHLSCVAASMISPTGGDSVLTAMHFYWKAISDGPNAGRRYYHLANIATPSSTEQICLYTKALCVRRRPFNAARAELENALRSASSRNYNILPREKAFAITHGVLFAENNFSTDSFQQARDAFTDLFESDMVCREPDEAPTGVFEAVTNCWAVLYYGSKISSSLHQILGYGEEPCSPSPTEQNAFWGAKELFRRTLEVATGQIDHGGALAYIHVTLVFLRCLTQTSPEAIDCIHEHIAWENICTLLNRYKSLPQGDIQIPLFRSEQSGPLFEDFMMRGTVWSRGYFSRDWFGEASPGDKRVPGKTERQERIICLGKEIAKSCSHLQYDERGKVFSLASAPGPVTALEETTTGILQLAFTGANNKTGSE